MDKIEVRSKSLTYLIHRITLILDATLDVHLIPKGQGWRQVELIDLPHLIQKLDCDFLRKRREEEEEEGEEKEKEEEEEEEE